MPINWRTDYSFRLLYELSRQGHGTRSTVRQLSDASGVPYDYARTLIRDLVSAGILKSRRGVGGGVEWARALEDVTVLDVFESMKEPASLALCTDAGGECGRSECCPMHNAVWRDLDEVIREKLGTTTFRHIATIGEELDPRSA